MNLAILKERLIEFIFTYIPKLLAAVFILSIGFALVNIMMRMLEKFLNRSRVDQSLHSFINSVSSVILKILVVVIAISTLGVEMNTFVAILGAGGVAVGLAIKDSLSNLAGGVLLLTFKPFTIGDFIEVGDKTGTVKQIEIMYTHINTSDNKRVVIPNGDLANREITNYSTESHRRVDLVFAIGYDNNIDHARKVINEVLDSHKTVLKEPESIIKVDSLGDNSVNIVMKAWTKGIDHLDTYYDLQEKIKKKFDEENIKMPYPQRDIHIINDEK